MIQTTAVDTHNHTRMSIITLAEQYITKVLTEQLDKNFHFHDLPHTIAVRDACLKLCDRLKVEGEDREILTLAALFHDTGYARVYQGHEAASIQIAEEFLLAHQYPEEKMAKVLACIQATVPDRQPVNLLESIIKDADLSNLGRKDYMTALANLRYEWEHFLGMKYAEPEWLELNHQFLKNHQYFTIAARDIYGDQLRSNQKHLKDLAKKDKGEGDSISNSKGAQMMFKTALRNHIDLSNLADNKANIMLSVNALIVTIVLPVAASYLRANVYLLVPMIFLLATCLTSMIFATLATRPIKMTGMVDAALIESGKANLFFFGNFYKMSFDQYKKGIGNIVSESENLDEAIIRDLFFLGRSLGNKYSKLRNCYNIFLVGIIITVSVFAVCYAISIS